jgi:flavin reductase (DIM6/NTAB) family NADH-FMN oxidoreductase RutF
MNIVTYCTRVSVNPPLWMIALYHNTHTKDSFVASRLGVLQLLTVRQLALVPVLGQASGYDIDKRAACGDEWVEASEYCPCPLLRKCAHYMRVTLLDSFEAGDHVMCLCQVEGGGEWNEETQRVQLVDDDAVLPALDHETVLYTGLLRQAGII